MDCGDATAGGLHLASVSSLDFRDFFIYFEFLFLHADDISTFMWKSDFHMHVPPTQKIAIFIDTFERMGGSPTRENKFWLFGNIFFSCSSELFCIHEFIGSFKREIDLIPVKA